MASSTHTSDPPTTAMDGNSQPPAPPQRLHPSMLQQLDPEYVRFHLEHVMHLVPPHTLPWDPAIRNAPAVPGGSEPLPVGSIKDFEVGKTRVRTYTPEGDVPEGGWNVFLFFHGGGWTLGTISSEASFCTNMCVHANCVVVSVDYRLAPENPYPAAVEDAVESLVWLFTEGPPALDINVNKIAVGGSSSGGNLATILAIKAKSLPSPIPLIFQLLIVPVTDNTATVETRWKMNQHAPWLTPDRMNWFKNNYLPNSEDWKRWDASPIFATREQLEGLPPAWIAVCDCDILCEEGMEYGFLMEDTGVEVEKAVYMGAPHPIMAMDGEWDLLTMWRSGADTDCLLWVTPVHRVGKKLVAEAADALKDAFAGRFQAARAPAEGGKGVKAKREKLIDL